MHIIEVKDKSGRNIYLTDERWKHISKHPEMQDKFALERIKETLMIPNVITQDKYDIKKYVYYRFYKDRGRHLLVSVKYLNGNGFIISSFDTDKIR